AIRFPLFSIVLPERIHDIRRSDNSSFWDQGYPALMLTDTSYLRNPHYHQPTDTPETLDYKRMAQVTIGAPCALRHLGNEGLERSVILWADACVTIHEWQCRFRIRRPKPCRSATLFSWASTSAWRPWIGIQARSSGNGRLLSPGPPSDISRCCSMAID